MAAEKTLKLHADVDPIYFSPNFKPMVKLVEILSAEARRAKHTTEDDSDADTLRTGVRVHALEGAVATLGDLGPAATVRDLRRAVARAVGVAAAVAEARQRRTAAWPRTRRPRRRPARRRWQPR